MNQFAENLKRNPSLPFGIIALIICLGFGFFRANQLVKLSASESELNAKLDAINLNIKHSQNIEQDIQELESLVSTIDERLFVSEEDATNIDFFYSLEEKLDIVISEVEQLEGSNIRFSKDGPDALKLHSVVDYRITVSGTFREVLEFLYEIYQIDAISRVTEFQIDPVVTDSDSGKLLAKVHVAVLAKK